jgi:outer membrane protein assembly factor BamA
LRIYNLRLFNDVEFAVVKRGSELILRIRVWERLHFYPFPLLFMNERSWKKWSYGAGLIHNNLWGKHIIANGMGWVGYNPGFSFRYENRWFGGALRGYTVLEWRNQTIRNREPRWQDQTEHHQLVTWQIGRRHGIYWYTDVTVLYDQVRLNRTALRWNPQRQRDHVGALLFQVKWDTRDRWDYPASGVQWQAQMGAYALLNGTRTFRNWRLDMRSYAPVFGTILASRILAVLNRGSVPVYQRVYLGYEERLRGHFYEIFSGENLALLSMEMRLPLRRGLPVSFAVPETLKPYFRRMTLDVYAGIFLEAGSVWDGRRGPGPLSSWPRGAGIGLHFVLPYSNVLRLEWAVNENGRSEWIVDMGRPF